MYDLRDPSYVPPHLRRAEGKEVGQVQGAEVVAEDALGTTLHATLSPDGEVACAEGAAAPPWAEARGTSGRPAVYPWVTMPVNGTFRVTPVNGVPKLATMRVSCAKQGKRLERVFRCHQYPDGVIEVWRKA
jgi:hypothetical protein